MLIPERGDIIMVNLSPTKGHEQSGYRPALVVSHTQKNKVTGFCQICPITSRDSGWPFNLKLIEGMITSGVIITDQVTCIDWQARNFKFVEKVPTDLLEDCIDMIHTFL